jgi:phage terminase small subunit
MIEDDLTPRQRRFVEALLTARSAREAAAMVGVGEKAAYRWLRLPHIKRAIAEAEGQTLEEVARRLLNMQGQALQALESVLNDPQAKQSDRIRAIELALSHVLRLREATALEERLGELERKVMEIKDELKKPFGTD